MIKKIKKVWADQQAWKQTATITFAILFLIALFIEFTPKKRMSPLSSKTLPVDTVLPLGMALQILNLSNKESLDALLGEYGSVSLFEAGASQPFVTGLKVFRAPKDPSQFAAAIPLQNLSEFVKRNKDLSAVLEQGQSRTGTKFVSRKSAAKRTILIGINEQ